MNYKHSTVASLIRRLRQYGSYVGCGCYGLKQGERCRRQHQCAQADYMAALVKLRRLLSTAPGSSGAKGE